jgi:hypothetical protein
MGAVADKDDLEFTLARPEGGEDGLATFQVFHSLKASKSKPKGGRFR